MHTKHEQYWRVGDANTAPNKLFLVPEVRAACADCTETDEVDDSHDDTVVAFYDTVPRLDFKWSAVPGAASYKFRCFHEGDYNQPLAREEVTQPRITVAADRLSEGQFMWATDALDANHQILAHAPLRAVRLQRDTEEHLLSLDEPSDGSVHQGKVRIRGEASPHFSLTCNGEEIDIGSDGHFKKEMTLQPGTNVLLFQLETYHNEVHYFFRMVHSAPR